MKYLEQKFILNNGIEMPKVGLGTYLMTDAESTQEAVTYALKNGYHLIDTAEYYQNHHIIREAINSSRIERKNLFVTTKVWPTHYGVGKTTGIIMEMRKELGLEKIDLVLLHWPALNFEKVIEAYKELETLYKEGVIGAIGVSNFYTAHLEILMQNTKIIPAVNQVELHPYLPLLDLQKFCKEHKIQLQSWQTIMKGEVRDIEIIAAMAEKYKVSATSVALKWALQQDIAVIPKSVTPERIDLNAEEINNFELTKEEIDEINNLEIMEPKVNPYTANFK